MKRYQIDVVISGGHRSCDPVEAEDLEAVKELAVARRIEVVGELSRVYPGEVIEAVEIYELVQVAAFNCRPKVATSGMNKDGQCKVCHRLHNLDQPCPLRIANAFTMQAQALEKLTTADRNWVYEHPGFSVLDVVEDAVVETMPVGQTVPL